MKNKVTEKEKSLSRDQSHQNGSLIEEILDQ